MTWLLRIIGCPSSTPHRWHSRAGGGAVHSIKSGHSPHRNRGTSKPFLSGRCGDLRRAAAPFALPAIDADGCRPVDGHPAHDAALVAVIIDRLVLRRAIVPDHHVA